MILDSAEKLIAYDEGRKLSPYQDSEGVWSIGIGHNLEANGMPSGIVRASPLPYPQCLLVLKYHPLTDSQCDALFTHDLEQATAGLVRYPFYAKLDDVRAAAVQDMMFNLGATRFAKFTNYQGLLDSSSYDAAAIDLREALVFRQLPARYGRLANMIETGEWPTV